MITALEKIREETLLEIQQAGDFDSLEEIRIRVLGKKGELTGILKGVGQLPPEERPKIGKVSNEIKESITGSLDEKIRTLEEKKLKDEILAESIDITLPGKPVNPGHIHPVNMILNEIREIFLGLGFSAVDGPEVETEFNNFEALNIPADHPAREMWDSFYFRPGLLLRSHTSPVQARIMKNQKPPVKIIVPGKCYRRDTVDATHHWMFHQVEGLLVDKNVTFADLKGILLQFARRMFGNERRAKFLPSYFPFTEPSAEMAIDCFNCQGSGCHICKQSGWIEILGAGMVNPVVFEKVGYDPSEYTGFAFGMGPERIAILKYGISDIRLFTDNDIRFLKQF